ncbi:MAG: NAD-binding protein [Bacteroidetes bacterium]|nr:NAD-binding protein [Bacteroidota bacterium]MBU1717558.1 NAD-binding protein [Bacteroidota bacterium]
MLRNKLGGSISRISHPKRGGSLRLLIAISSLFAIVIIGVGGYSMIEKMDFLNSLYMTVITIATVGFREVGELSDGGKIFTIILIIVSLGIFAYSLSVISTHFIEGRLAYFLSGKSKKTKQKRMENHVIVCGYGRNGRQAVRELLLHRHPFIVIDSDHELVLNNDEKGVDFLEGDATEDEVLERAGIKTAKALICSFPNDADNLYVVLTARSLNPKLTIISRAASISAEKKLRTAGVSNVVLPEKVGGAHMATLVIKPDIVEFLEHLSLTSETATKLEEILCSELPDNLKDLSIYELGIRRTTGANIVGFKTPEGDYIINPSPDTRIIPNSKIFVLGTAEQIRNMKSFFKNDLQ